MVVPTVYVSIFFTSCTISLAKDNPVTPPSDITWHIVWTGGQSNSVGTNSQTSGFPTWPTNPLVQMYCW